jgi:4-amino-4-deoxy-L-arabinose transferase-like glycosyltransferase
VFRYPELEPMQLPAKRTAALSAAVFAIAAAKLALHLYAGRHYGYFVDELYYLACSRHLAWGYVDQPPLVAAVVWLIRHTLGDSLPALRLLPALAGAALIVLAGMLARSLGGGRFAQAIAGIGLLVAPGMLVMHNMLTMNAWEPLFWTGAALIALRIVQTGNTKLWIWFGVLAGLGLENKYSMAIWCGGIVLGLLLTAERRVLASRWLWIGGAIAFLIFLPNLLWNLQHHFPFVELQRNIHRSGRDVTLGPLVFLGQEIFTMLPLTLPLWAGLSNAGPSPARHRFLTYAFLFTALVIMLMSPRIYYLFPAFPVLFAAGGVALERWLARPRLAWIKPAYAGLLLAAGALVAPIAIPLLPPEQYTRYTQALHMEQPRIENHKSGALPQLLADQFGWDEMAAEVGRIYNALPPDVRTRTAIFGQNYGEAGAIDFFGPKYGLPGAISGHQNYFIWGPRGYTGESMIVMDDRPERLQQLFNRVEKAGRVDHPYSMPYRHFDVYYCTGLKMPMADLWPRIKAWD